MAAAVTDAGGLGCIGVGPRDTVEFIERESTVARGDGSPRKFGVGLMVWVLESRPELFDAAVAQRPHLLAISFGSVRSYVDRAHHAGALVATHVNTRQQVMEAAESGADIIVAQGSDAGGHSGYVGTLPILQIALQSTEKPVFAAGGIASPAGVAAVLAAGAEAAWVGTAFLLSPESDGTEAAKDRIAAASEDDTILTTVFDRASQLAWPPQHPGRALRNKFSDQWHSHEQDLVSNAAEIARFRQGAKDRDYDITSIYAGQAVGLMSERRSAGDVVRWIGEGAEDLLRRRMRALMPS